MDNPRDSVDSYDVYQWPEFKALVKRLGIVLTKTTKLEIVLEINKVAIIKQESLGSDTDKN